VAKEILNEKKDSRKSCTTAGAAVQVPLVAVQTEKDFPKGKRRNQVIVVDSLWREETADHSCGCEQPAEARANANSGGLKEFRLLQSLGYRLSGNT
jgi:hypothetical protein